MLLGWRVERGVRSVGAKRKERQTHIMQEEPPFLLVVSVHRQIMEKNLGEATGRTTTQRGLRAATLKFFCRTARFLILIPLHYSSSAAVVCSGCGTVKCSIPIILLMKVSSFNGVPYWPATLTVVASQSRKIEGSTHRVLDFVVIVTFREYVSE